MLLSLKCRPNPDESIDKFMSHENAWHSSPLADLGAVRSGVKFDILDCLQAPKGTHDVTKECTIVLIDMAVIVYMIPHTRATTFKEYFTIHMASYVKGVPQISTNF